MMQTWNLSLWNMSLITAVKTTIDADTEDQHQASDPDGGDSSDVGLQPAVQKRRRKSQDPSVADRL